ncbi:hypothetical protein RHMOL_Rhmol06G0168700 [Rhododendron molle]|uniref:Uncharacterized protein n=1 Tax=Rhododendron molle TaxID=49168 RepID=A0ACC0NDA9_RHOML|nr:hypothetical protein RHMOL_Rhmol06G0168700 [Rhododendron molle]
MTEEVEIGVADDVNPVEQSSLQASDGEALISSLLKTRKMMAEEEKIGVAIDIEPVEQSWPHIPDLMKEFEFEDFMNLGSSYDKKDHEIDEGDNGSVDEVEIAVPQCGMIFDTADEAYNFYNGYARKIGFSVRKQRTYKSKADQTKILRQVLVCSCEGTYKKIRTPRKRRENRRFDCKALLEFKLIGDKYQVIQFMSEHTHDLVPPQSAHYLRSQRRIEFSQVGLIDKMRSSGFKQSDIYSYMSTEAGGPQYLNFIPSDCYNLIQKKRAGFLKKGDSQCLLEYFKQKTQENKHFFYSFRTTNENEVRGVFFCDAKSRRDYGLFGDAICFDTTFRTNNYDMLCAPIVGINNHGQTTLFGCGLLDGETTDAVMWLFTTFLEAMGGKKPVSIFTDQSRAIANVISAMFPDSHHGLCLWHIYQNAAKHLSQVFAGFKSFTSRFKACIYDGETIEEFEESWKKLLVDFKLTDNVWLQKLYEFREKWAQVYSRAYFCAGMTTTQRSESINKFLKKYFGSTLVLREFVDQYAKAMASRREKEREVENKTQQTSPILVSQWSVEREASEKYTKKVFYLFQKEYQQTLDLSLKLENDDGTISTYIVKELEGWKKIPKLVYNPLEHSVSCTCRKFEFHGILCSHSLKLFRDLQYESLPPRYYLKRWTRTIVDEDIFDLHGDLIPNDTDLSLTIRYSGLSQISQRIVSKGSKFADVSSLTEVGLLVLEAKVESWISSRNANQNVTSNAQNSSTLNVDDEAPLRDPTKKQRRCQGGKGENSTTKAMTRSKPLKEVEEDENAHDTTSTQGPHVEQPNMAANVGMNALQVPNSSCTSRKPSNLHRNVA